MSIARNINDVLYVSGGGSNNIIKFDTLGNVLGTIAHPDLPVPQGIAFDDRGHFFSSSFSQNNIVEFDENDNYVRTITAGNLQVPRSIAFEHLDPVTAVEEEIIISEFRLEQNFPNPFNPSTKIKFTISTSPLNPSPYQGKGQRERLITLKVYDVLGNKITTLINEENSAGIYEVEFSGEGLSSGIYYYKIQAGNFFDTKKMILIK
ncbi:MAG: T9SS type A sorting domain-containing protein, partial [Ignavibacterium sp.]